MDKGLTLASMLNDVPISPLGRRGQVQTGVEKLPPPVRRTDSFAGGSQRVVMVRAMRRE